MCLFDDSDGSVTLLSKADPVARKAHKCRECGRRIDAGEQYHVDRFIWEGKLDTFKVCRHCMVVRGWLHDECGGWLYGAVEEDIREHAYSGHYPRAVLRLAVGMEWQWRAPSGRMLPVPATPQTTHERLDAARAAGEKGNG